ncbi:MAG: hypothetical protein GY699_21625 [Desulfobacteraceae bacterium]|nr:hypothetical protein [Desulfobacteraceae bacterium]
MRRIANDNIMSVVTDLFFLSVHPNLRQVIENDNPTLRQRVAEDFKKFCIHSKRYDQIRFLDKTGMEKIRINFNQNRPGIVSKDKLQNKSKRYYFTDTIALESGRIFVSPFDLNIENGQIQHPLKPMIRFGTPVLDLSGQKKGIVLFNYFGETLIHNLEQALSDSVNSFMLLNSQGYWLRGQIPEDEWGFMYENRKDQTLAKRHPEVWKKISADNEGQITSDQGIYTFTTIWPLGSGMLSSTGSAVANQASDSVLSGKNFFWKIVLQVPASKIAAVKTIILYKWLPYLSAIFISIVFLSLALSLAVSQRKKAIDAKLQKEKLQGVLEMAGAVCHELNQPMQVILGASQMMSFDVEKNDPIQDQIKLMDEHIVRMGVITQKLMNITKYKTKSYLKKNIIDIDEASDLIGT